MIPSLLNPLEALFGWLLAASWQASVLALFVLLIQKLLGSRLNPRWRYALWLLVLLRLVLPALPESALSIFQFTPPTPALLEDSITQRIFIPSTSLPAPTFHADIAPKAPPFTFYSLLAIIWLAGAVSLLILTWIINHRFARQVTKSPAISDPELCKLFAEAKAELGIQRTTRLIENSHVQSPAIMGLFQPTLLLPADVRQKFDVTELRFIFLHELAHLKRGDVIVQGLIALLQILHWFNPVLWFAFRRMRIDREPATDALVLSRTGEAEKERYGLMLIKLLEHFNQRHSLPTLVGILEDKDQFKRRFSLIAKFTRGAYGWSVLGVLLIGILSIAFLTKSKASILQPSPATNTSAIRTSEPLSNARGSNSNVMIRLNLKVVQIDDDDYQAHRAEIDAAVLQGDIQPMLRLKSYRPVIESPVTTKVGEQCVIENVRVMIYSAKPGERPSPVEYRRNLGVRFVSIPSFSSGKVSVTGHLEVTRLSGWITQEDNYHEPYFAANLTAVSDTFILGQIRGYASNGATAAYADPYFYFTPDKPPNPSQSPMVVRRIFFFLSAQAFHQDGRPTPQQEIEGASQKADALMSPPTATTATPPIANQQPTSIRTLDIDPNPAPTNGTLVDLALSLKNNADTIPSTHQRLQILQAFYGADGSWRDVTGFLQKSVQNNFLKISWQQPYIEIGGDPAYLKVKTLIVSYRLDGVEKLSTFCEENPSVGLQAVIPTDDEGNSQAQKRTTAYTIRSSAPTNEPAASAPLSGSQIEIGVKVAEINDEVYLANKEKIDAAIDKGGPAMISLLNDTKEVSMLSMPSVTTQPGTKANMDIVREFPYPVSFENGKFAPNGNTSPGGQPIVVAVPPTPREFVTKNVGISAEITPSLSDENSPAHGKIILNGKLSVTNFEGFTKSNYNVIGMPSFSTSESLFIEALDDHELKGIWVPGEYVSEKDPAARDDKYNDTSKPQVKKRYLLIVSAEKVR